MLSHVEEALNEPAPNAPILADQHQLTPADDQIDFPGKEKELGCRCPL
jgi:hypothetical protein